MAISAWVVGGAAVLAGGVLLYFNRAETRVMEDRAGVSVVPMVGDRGLGIAIAGSLP